MSSMSCDFNAELKWCNNTASLSKFDGDGDEVTRSTFLQRHSASVSHSDDSLLHTKQQITKNYSCITDRSSWQHLKCYLFGI